MLTQTSHENLDAIHTYNFNNNSASTYPGMQLAPVSPNHAFHLRCIGIVTISQTFRSNFSPWKAPYQYIFAIFAITTLPLTSHLLCTNFTLALHWHCFNAYIASLGAMIVCALESVALLWQASLSAMLSNVTCKGNGKPMRFQCESGASIALAYHAIPNL